MLCLQLTTIGFGLSIFIFCISSPRIVVKFLLDVIRDLLESNKGEEDEGKSRRSKKKRRVGKSS